MKRSDGDGYIPSDIEDFVQLQIPRGISNQDLYDPLAIVEEAERRACYAYNVTTGNNRNPRFKRGTFQTPFFDTWKKRSQAPDHVRFLHEFKQSYDKEIVGQLLARFGTKKTKRRQQELSENLSLTQILVRQLKEESGAKAAAKKRRSDEHAQEVRRKEAEQRLRDEEIKKAQELAVKQQREKEALDKQLEADKKTKQDEQAQQERERAKQELAKKQQEEREKLRALSEERKAELNRKQEAERKAAEKRKQEEELRRKQEETPVIPPTPTSAPPGRSRSSVSYPSLPKASPPVLPRQSRRSLTRSRSPAAENIFGSPVLSPSHIVESEPEPALNARVVRQGDGQGTNAQPGLRRI